jgi:hypothetical protein
MSHEEVGYTWLEREYGVRCVQPLPAKSFLGTSAARSEDDGRGVRVFRPHYRPREPGLRGQLEFALKHEGVNLEFLARLFRAIHIEDLEAWVQAEARGQYARRAGFIYEWLTGGHLAFEGVKSGPYVDALPADDYLTASSPETTKISRRWRVRDNFPGVPGYCPTVRLVNQVKKAVAYDVSAELKRLENQFGAPLLMRTAVWLTVKESRASFAIEHEDDSSRIKRFAAAMERHTGRFDRPLVAENLRRLQDEILGEAATARGARQSPVFVGHTDAYHQVVDYIAPRWDQTPEMLAGLEAFLARTAKQPTIARSAVASFGFVYIHPLSDGNGRVSRFLINDTLRRDKAVPEPFILPVSAAITDSTQLRAGYDRVLETFSRPLLSRYRDAYRFGDAKVYEDGVRSNLEFDAYDDAALAWRYTDFTSHVEYLGAVIEETVSREMRGELLFLRNHDRARRDVKEFIEGPDQDIDRIIRSIRENNFRISGKIRREFPVLDQFPERANALVEAVREAFAEEPADDTEADEAAESSPKG